MELVTGYRGMNHVTAEQLADLQAGIIGYDACVLNIGEKMKADVITSNKIRIFDGVFVFCGKQAIIEAGDYEDITIENGTIGFYRNDIIAVEYKKDEGSGVENTNLKVIKGATSSTAKDPVVTTNDVRTGASESEIALYRVKLNGLAIEKVEQLCKVCDNLASLKSYFANSLAEVTGKLSAPGTLKPIFISDLNVPFVSANVLYFYRYDNTALHAPASTFGTMASVYVDSNSYCIQFAFDLQAGVYMRVKTANTWSTWISK